MKKFLFLLLIHVILPMTIFSQYFNTGKIMKKNTFSIGIEPVIIAEGGNEGFNLFLYGGYGIGSRIDMNLKAGLGNENYFGADVEWGLGKNTSLTTGAHNYGNFGLDVALNLSFPIKKSTSFFTGIDTDINFNNDIDLLLWIPLGVEVMIKQTMGFIFEAEIGVTDPAYHVFGGGLNFYL